MSNNEKQNDFALSYIKILLAASPFGCNGDFVQQ
jgi:hypothetical protein